MSIKRTDEFLSSLGPPVYRVGGSVRDELLGKRPKDADYVIFDVPLGDVRSLLGQHRGGKLKLRDGQHVGYRIKAPYDAELVLPRKERSTGPRHDDFEIVVDPHLTLEEDAIRRDFTFNALYKSVVTGEVIDPTKAGLWALQHRIVQITHPDSFRDDPLRILRALRFVAQGYDLSERTAYMLRQHSDAITGLTANGFVSGTVFTEMSRILMGPDNVKALRIARDTGVLAVLFPELKEMLGFDQGSRYHDLTTDEHTFKALEAAAHVDAPLNVRWALLFHDSGKPATAWVGKDGRRHYYKQADNGDPYGFYDNTVLPWELSVNQDHQDRGKWLWDRAADRMNIDKDTKRHVGILIAEHMLTPKKAFDVQVRRMRVKFGDRLVQDLIMHRMLDSIGKEKGVDRKMLKNLAKMEAARAAAQKNGVPAKVSDLGINGNDMMSLGAEGKEVGEILRAVLDEVVVRGDDVALTSAWQFQRAKSYI